MNSQTSRNTLYEQCETGKMQKWPIIAPLCDHKMTVTGVFQLHSGITRDLT